jgi:hypothetical protein
MNSISTKKQYIKTDGWRGYEQPINAICGANNTGNWSDSPAPADVCLSELAKVKHILRVNNIKYKQIWCRSSNVFCVHGYILTHESNKETAKELIKSLIPDTQLLYLC